MALSRNHSAVADATFSSTGAANWNAGHAISGAVSGGIPYFDSTTSEATSALLAANGVIVGGGAGAAPSTISGFTFGAATGQGLLVPAGTATTAVPALSTSQTTNASGTTFNANTFALTYSGSNGDSAQASNVFRTLGGTTGSLETFSIRKDGVIQFSVLNAGATSVVGTASLICGPFNGDFTMGSSSPGSPLTQQANHNFFSDSNGNGLEIRSSGAYRMSSTTSPIATADVAISRGGTSNSVVFSQITAGGGAVTSRTEINKAVTAFSDGVAKAVLTYTVPNTPHSASFEITLVASMGAGGAIGANESTRTIKYRVDIARTAGVNAVATISAAYPQAAAASVAGANDIAVTAALSAISGAVGATNTFTVNATLTKSGGASDNHTLIAHSQLLNANASGVTVA